MRYLLLVRALLPCVCFLTVAACSFPRNPNTYQITPSTTTMLVGESRPFRLVDDAGHAQVKVTWILSDEDAFASYPGDELHLVAKRAGDFRLTARTDFAVAEATIRVVEGPALTPGSVKWSSGAIKGCVTTRIIPVPRPAFGGPDVYEQSRCDDGEYIAGYTSAGVQLWRRKINDNGIPSGAGAPVDYDIIGNRLEPRSASVCDSLSPFASQQQVRELLAARRVSFHEQGSASVWLVEETNAQCKLWFDDKLLLFKKRKVFVTQ